MVDAGFFISVTGEQPEDVSAALRLAQEKWGGTEIYGNARFIKRCLLAAELYRCSVLMSHEIRPEIAPEAVYAALAREPTVLESPRALAPAPAPVPPPEPARPQAGPRPLPGLGQGQMPQAGPRPLPGLG
jgi:hypothetical protein